MSSRSNTSNCRTNVLLLLLLVLLGMSVEVHGRPVKRTERSAEDIIAGVDFLSVFMKSADERSAADKGKITTSSSTETIQSTQLSSDIDQSTTVTHIDDSPTTIQNNDQETDIITNKPVNTESSKHKSTTETIPVTLVSLETNTEIHESTKIRRGKNQGGEDLKVASSKFVVSVKNPSAIVAEARKNEFSVDESEPIVIDTNKSPNDGVKFKTKSEDLVAIGANPDYIAQQHARIHREGVATYNQPYGNRNPSSRGRSVSYSSAVQELPHPHTAKSWQQDDESIRDTIRRRGNTPVSIPKDYDTNPDYDYTESYQDYNEKQNSTKAQSILTNNRQGDAVAESKDYYVTRKYNSGDFNDSGDKSNRNGKQDSSVEGKRHVEPTERNWGIPEKNYEILESNHHTNPTVYGTPEENYEIDEAISVMTNGRAHGLQGDHQQKLDDKPLQIKVGQTPVKPDDNQKIGYVVEGRNFRKYRVEERTSDGFIVGEYGVVSNNDGSLRGVRYTADGTINPRVIYDALMKFLSL